jgi:hypothetical protein
MTVTYGFYNSINQDRCYNALQMSSIFDGVIRDGIFGSIPTCFMVTPGTGLNVVVGTGRAWLNHTWTSNDALLPLAIETPHLVHPRIDAVILEVNAADSVRANTIKVITGTPLESPVYPTLTNNATLHQYALAYVTVAVGTTSFVAANITNMVGVSTPFVTGPLSILDSTALLTQWQGRFTIWYDSMVALLGTDLLGPWEATWTAWFNEMKDQLSTDAAGNLQLQIDAIEANSREKLTADRTYYVRTDGNDSNTGLVNTSGGAFRTIQKAVDTVATLLDLGSHTVTISIADGSYTENVLLRDFIASGGSVTISGNNTTPSNVVLTNTGSGVCFSYSGASGVGGSYKITGMKIQAASEGAGILLYVQNHRNIWIDKLIFGRAATHMLIENYSTIGVTGVGGYQVDGNCSEHICVDNHSYFEVIDGGMGVVSVLKNPCNILVWIKLDQCSTAKYHFDVLNKDRVVGYRYVVNGLSLLSASGSNPAFLPGTMAGVTNSGGLCI